jgi:ketosteroid isomerase-like protein
MTRENVEIVRSIYAAWGRGDYDAALALIDREVEWFGPPDISGSGLEWGHAGVRRSLIEWVGAWDDYEFELRDVVDFGDDVLSEGRQRGRGKGGGVDVAEAIFSVWTIRPGHVVRQRMFRDRAQTLEAVGPRE